VADLKGLKRICMSCGARFYDLNKKPIICPSCTTEYTGEIKVKARRGRLPIEDDVPVLAVVEEAVVEEAEEEELEAVAEGDDVLVSLEDIEEAEDDDDDIAEDDDDIDIEEDLVIEEEDLEDIEEDVEEEEEEEEK
jgi:uncharacterized protein (TIGR02300 family)